MYMCDEDIGVSMCVLPSLYRVFHLSDSVSATEDHQTVTVICDIKIHRKPKIANSRLNKFFKEQSKVINFLVK